MTKLLEMYPNLGEGMLLNWGCYLLSMKNETTILYDCRQKVYKRSWKLRGFGYQFDRTKVYYKSKVTTRHIEEAPSGVIYEDIQFIYKLDESELDSFVELIDSSQKELNKYLYRTTPIHKNTDEEHFFCAPSLGVIAHVLANCYTEHPTWCKAYAVYSATEELSLVAPHSTGYTWWYYPGRMYSRVNWYDIPAEQYIAIRDIIISKEELIFNRLNLLMGE